MGVYWELQTCWDTACNSIQLSRVYYELSPYAIVNGRNYLFYDNQKGRFLNIKGNMMSFEQYLFFY